MPLEELFPSRFSIPLGCWFDAVPPQNIGDRAAGTFMSQIGQCTLNPAVTPVVILADVSECRDQCEYRGEETGTSRSKACATHEWRDSNGRAPKIGKTKQPLQ